MLIRIGFIVFAIIVVAIMIKRNPALLSLLKEAGSAVMSMLRFLR